MTSLTPLLSVERLSVRFPRAYGAVPVLEDLDLRVERGEAVGLVGESGSGKSLLAQTIIGMLPPGAVSTGAVKVNGQDMLKLSQRTAAAVRGTVVSYIDQNAMSALNPNRRVGAHFRDLWDAGGGPRDDWRTEALRVLERVSLPSPERLLGQFQDELSGGMRQRVLIALAVFRRPRLLIADEPTTALDRLTAAEVLDLLRELQQDLGMALIVISHDLATVSRIADRIAVLYAGQLCESGPTHEVVARPLHRYTAALLGSLTSLHEGAYPLLSIPGVVPDPAGFPSGCRFRTRCAWAESDCERGAPLVQRRDHRAWCVNPVSTHHSLGRALG
jgi:oligopeptide/dipeptide ABC transporter ATP-binding protein